MREPGLPLRSRVAGCLGVEEAVLVPASGGAGNLAFEVHDPSRPGAPVAFLRTKSGDGGLHGIGYSLAREGDILIQVARLGFPVAEVLGTFDEPDSLLMGVVPGNSRPDRDEIEIVGPKYMALIAGVHAADSTSFPVHQHATMREAMEADFALWLGEAHERGLMGDPLMALAVRVLTELMPPGAGQPNLVHGDAGAGNFMCEHGEVTAMLDWELAHLGDFHEDLAWMWMRGAHTEFGDPARRIREYEIAAGRGVELHRVHWQLGLVMWKSAVSLQARLFAPVIGELAMVQQLVRLTYDALLGSQLVGLLGGSLALGAQQSESSNEPEMVLAAEMLAIAVLPADQRVVLEYLRDSFAHAKWERRALVHDCRTLLGIEPDDLCAQIERCSSDQLLNAAIVVARHVDRRALAMPKAVRRIQRAQRIGLGTGE